LCLDDSGAVVDAIRRTVADVILVGMGNPRQELWLDNNLPATGCQLGVAVGALLDFLAGEVPRAGEWTRAARLEWVHRLFCEPKRLSSRYLLGNPAFLFGLRLNGPRAHACPADVCRQMEPYLVRIFMTGASTPSLGSADRG
jgi:UDP-N-acetyl-D-mannosaminuronic acid transferase (WecB/TagA/CpsF family)